MKTNRFSISGLALLTTVAWLAGINSTQAATCPGDGLRLSEICFLPLPEQPQWVELINTGSPFAAGGVEIVSNNRSYSVPSELSPIPSNGIVVVYFDGAGPGGNDYSFDGDNRAVLHSPAGVTNALGSLVGFCALYRVTGAHSKETLLDFVAWGAPPGDAAADAVEKRVWGSKGRFIPTSNDPRFASSGPGASLPTGGSIALTTGGAGWGGFPFDAATPGTANTNIAPPQLLRPGPNEWSLESPTVFEWEHRPEASKYELQISTDAGFSSTFVETLNLRGTTFRPSSTDVFPTNTYFWRVRSVAEDGRRSVWSETRSFRVGIESPSPPAGTKGDRRTKAGDFSVAGRVTCTRTGNGLGNATVEFRDSSTPPLLVASDVTDSFGRFAVSLPGGQYSVSIVHDWFQIEGGDMTLNVTADNNSVAIRAEGQAGEAAVTPLGAQKDTSMLVTRNAINRSGAGWMCDKDNTGDQAWDAPHAHPHNGFDGGQEWQEGWYCWAVSACMIARYYGGTVTRDEIVEESKDTRLGFGSENAAFDYEEQRALRFALQATDAQIHYTYTKRTWNEVVNAIDAGRPIFYVEAGHVMTIDAYEFRSGPSGDAQFWCRFVNRDNLGAKPFLNYDTMSWWRGAIPDSGLTGRTTDSRVSADYDSDGALDHTSDDDSDGICNYDEEVRFRRGRAIYLDFADCGALGANSSDTDNDKIADKREVESWVFPCFIEKPRKGDISALTEKDFNLPDVDNDHKYPEVDDDSDDGGIKDGDEDADHNGVFGDEETDVFDKNDDGSLDLVFCIDNTGSMRDDIDAVKAQAINIVNETAAQFKDFRIAVVAYRDFPVDPYGDPGDFVTRDCLGFSTNKSAIVAAINSMGADGGADWDEAVYSAIMHCIDGSTLGGWRKAPVQRKILVMGDAPPHDPEPFTGYTLAGVTAAASAGGVVWEEPYTGSSTKGDDEEHSGPISAITILIGSDSGALASFTDIARETDGTLIRAAIAGDVPRAVLEALERIKTDPIAILEVNGNYRDTNIVADASKSVDGDGCGIVLYEWDWNGDGVYDETTFTPTVPHDYTTGFGGKVRVRITTVAGKTATASYIILVPEFIDVTQYVDLESLASHLDRASGAIVCDIVLGNKTDTVKTMRDKFYFAIPSTTNMFLANPDGTLEDGTPYADITALVEAALPSIGDGDLELDPGETVRLEDAIKIYSRDRSMPVGFVFAVWADPLRSAPIHYATASPTLKAVHLPNKLLELSWSASLSEYQLEVADSLASSSWTTVSETPMLQAQQNSVTVPIGAGAKFYRLKQK